MEKNEYKIETVEFYYNGEDSRFDTFLNSLIRNYINADKTLPDYAGLLRCGDCGSTMVCKTRRWKDKPPRYEYTCNGYHRYGKENCTPHTIGEEVIDKLIYEELNEVKKMALENFKKVDKQLKKWLADKPSAEKQIAALNEKLAQRKLDQQQILLERIRDREHA